MTSAVGIWDASDTGKLALTGPQAKEFLQGQVSNDVEALEPGAGVYAAFLTNKGKMLGDLRVLDAGDELLLLCERVALQELFNLVRRFSLGYEVELHKRTLERGLLSLIGPGSRELADAEALPDEEHSHTVVHLDGVPARVIATHLGVDLLCAAADTERLAAVLRARGAVPIDEEQVELARIESGRPRYGIDLDESVIPQEAGLNERAVSFTKGCYVGQETVARLFYRGKPNRHLRGLVADRPLHRGDPVVLGEKTIGTVSSAAESPRFGPIALAILRREAEPGADVRAGDVSARVSALPFA